MAFEDSPGRAAGRAILQRQAVSAFILAGGRGQRFGGADKALLELAGTPLIGHVIARLAGQVGAMVISANGDPARFARFGCPVVADDPAAPATGVFAGLVSALRVLTAPAAAASGVLIIPTDTPFLPDVLVERLTAALSAGTAPLAFATSCGRAHPIIALWTAPGLHRLCQHLEAGDQRPLHSLLPAIGGTAVDFPAEGGDPFYNVNTPEDLATAAARLAATRLRGTP